LKEETRRRRIRNVECGMEELSRGARRATKDHGGGKREEEAHAEARRTQRIAADYLIARPY